MVNYSRSTTDIIYLDNAATTFPKPFSVVNEVQNCLKLYCGNPGRGTHSLSVAAATKVYDTRECAARLFSCSDPGGVVFTMNTTYAINIAIKSVVKKGDHVLLSSMEHNSVLRPVEKLCENGIITYSVFDAFSNDVVSEIKRKIRPNTTVLICAHASNICGRVLPIFDIGKLLREKGIFFIVDAAQSAGRYKINVEEMKIDALCVPGHKGLYGIQGCGMLILGSGKAGETLIEGGGGINSLDLHMPDFLPDRFEAGTMPTPAIAGLYEGMRFVERHGVDEIREKEEYLCKLAVDKLKNIHGVKMYSERDMILFNIEGRTSSEVSERLDLNGICARGGFHCTPLCHRALGTGENGAVRISFGFFNGKHDVLRLCDRVLRISQGKE